jgi:hypothetical protein
MELNSLPPEVLGLILGHLIAPDDPKWAPKMLNFESICNARLVCRKWNSLASNHLFRDISLQQNPDAEEEFTRWHEMVNNDVVRAAAKRVTVHSIIESAESDDEDVWDDECNSNSFTFAVSRINRLPNLRTLELSFSSKCRGVENDFHWDDGIELIPARLNTLRVVFRFLKERAADRDNNLTPIRSLVLKNLQNAPLDEFYSSDLFKDVIKEMTQVHLLILDEYDEAGPDHDLERIERREFEPYLRKAILPCFSDQLTSLTLYFDECWGVCPGYFEGKGLFFPNLKTLSLGSYVIGHNDQFDWVLSHASLTSLRLDMCFIVSHMVFHGDCFKRWAVPTHDWTPLLPGSYGFVIDDPDYPRSVFTYEGTWEKVFDGIRSNLSRLTDFRFDAVRQYGLRFCEPENLGTTLFPGRYITFDSGLLPSPWIQADVCTGDLEFGNNNPAPMSPEDSDDPHSVLPTLNRAQDTEEGDRRALEALVQAVRERR